MSGPSLSLQWLDAAGLVAPRRLTPLAGGGNNRAYRLESAGGPALVKHYVADERRRLETETEITRRLRAHGVDEVPALLASDPAQCVAAYEWVEGETPKGDASQVEQAGVFLQRMQRARPGWTLPASDDALEPARHLERVAARVSACLGIDSLAGFFREHLQPRWKAALEQSVPAPLEPSSWLLSPSDFGFHNALVERSGRVRFLDLEYAGLDDPAKVVADFYAQPRIPAALGALASFAVPPGRLEWMWSVTVVKWLCILFNPWLPEHASRKAFASERLELEAQLERARALLERERLFRQELLG